MLLPAVFVVAVVLVRALYARATGFVAEDALITLRYAENLASGVGFVFNPGEHVLGTTAPLHALLLAGVERVLGAAVLILAATALGVAAAAADAWLLFRLCRRAGLPDAVPVAAVSLFAVAYEPVVAAIDGMETMLVTALMLLSLLLACEGRARATALACAALVVARIDGLSWVVLVGVCLWLTDRRCVPWRAGLLFIVALLPWAVIATGYFGSPVPHTVLAKRAAYAAPRAAAHMAALWAPLHPLESGGGGLGLAMDVLFAAGTVAAWRAQRLPLLAMAVHVPLSLALLFLLSPVVAPWYVAVLVPGFYLVAAYGFVDSARRAFRGGDPGGAALALKRGLFLGGLVAVVALLAVGAGLRTIASIPVLRRFMVNARAVHRAAGEYLSTVEPDAKVLAEPIGFLGFYGRRTTWDTVGLVAPAVTRARMDAGQRWYGRIVRAWRPDYIVLRRRELTDNVIWGEHVPLIRAEDRALWDGYAEIRSFPPVYPEWGAELVILRRRR